MRISLLLFCVLGLLTCTSAPKKNTFAGVKKARRPASLDARVDRLNPKKPTVCTLTINSPDEREAFAKYLPEFNHLELMDLDGYGDDEAETWFDHSCNTKLKCDILMISGHFAGDFFGDGAPLRLTMEHMEELSCQKRCDGVFKAPKEVFLFGCNTLGGKDKGTRTQAEYIQVLLEHDYKELDAQRIAAFRYSPIGTSFNDRMARIFPNAAKIYGYSEASPLGKYSGPRVKNYFKMIPDYSKHLKSISKESENPSWKKSMEGTTAVQTAGQTVSANKGICLLYDPSKKDYQKAIWVNEVLSSETSALENLPGLSLYIEKDIARRASAPFEPKFDGIVAFENRLKEKVSTNRIARDIFEKYINLKDTSMLSIQAAMVKVGHHLSWFSKMEMDRMLKDLMGDLRQPISEAVAYFICENKIKLQNLTAQDLNPGNYGKNDVMAISCLEPDDVAVAPKLVPFLDQKEMRPVTLVALTKIGAFDPGVTRKVLTIAKAEKESNASYLALSYLGTSTPYDSKVHSFLLEKYNGQDSEGGDQKHGLIRYIVANKLTDPESIRQLMESFTNPSSSIEGSTYARNFIAKEMPCKLLPDLKNVEDSWKSSADTWTKVVHTVSEDAGESWNASETSNFEEVSLVPTVTRRCKK